MAVGWLVVVVAAAALTFAAVDNADKSVGQPLTAPKVTGHLFPSRSSSSARRSPTPAAPTPSTAATPTTPATPVTPATAAPPTAAVPAPPLSTPPAAQRPPKQTQVPPTSPEAPPSSASTPHSDPPATSTPRPPRVAGPSTPARSATFRTEGGSATASCRGSILALTAIAPQDGWHFHQESDQNHLDVKFDNGVQEIEIGLACVGGSPAEVTS